MVITDIRNKIKNNYKAWRGIEPDSIAELPLSGSNRKYFRIFQDGNKVIGTYNNDKNENTAYFYLQNQLQNSGVNVPAVYFKNESEGIYFQEDLGTTNLYEYVTGGSEISKEHLLVVYKKVIEQMPALQYKTAQNLDFSRCYPREAFDRQSIQWDLNYFKYNFLKLAGVPFHEQKLEDDFQTFITFLLEAPGDFFLFRDFQSRNIILKDQQVFFIDFQGGRRGALQYDLASLLYESKIGLTTEIRQELLNYYLNVFSEYSFFKKKHFMQYYPAYALVRLLQAFGAYGYRGIFEKKSFFVKSIAQGVANLKEIFSNEILQQKLPYISSLLPEIDRNIHNYNIPELNEKITVTINSFSYKNGLPDDWSGNGGGYVFDCRSLPNPGRFEQYRNATGRDKEVIDFLKNEPDVEAFLTSARSLLAQTLNKYISRGFNHLSVSFGCTGGQHRSVYCAEQTVKYLKNAFNVQIHLIHRELNMNEKH
jgi:aminoglycoside/choline kinase family phosphotransferase